MQTNSTPTLQHSNTPSSDETTALETDLAAISTQLASLTGLRSTITALEDQSAHLTEQMTQVRRLLLSRTTHHAPRRPGSVTDDCARHIAAQFIAHCARSNKLEALCSHPAQREALATAACHTLDISTRAALTTGDIPLPNQYSGQIRELISEFGVVRRQMSPYPIGMGIARPARMGLRPAFGSIPMSALIGERSPTITFAS